MGNYLEIINRSPSGLVDALCKRITNTLASFWQEGEFPDEEEFHTPFVHAQLLPVSKTESDERDKTKDFPFVQVVCPSGTVSDFNQSVNGSEINIDIYFGGYRDDPDNQGWRIPESMLWQVLRDFCEDKLTNGYMLQAPVKWTLLDNDKPPYYFAVLETKWQGSPPAIETPYEGS